MSSEQNLGDINEALLIRIDQLEADKENLKNEIEYIANLDFYKEKEKLQKKLSAAVTRNNELEGMIISLMDSFNSLDTAEEMTIEDILRREG